VSGDFISALHDFIFGIIPSQQCHMNMGQIHEGYGAMDI
jgi:hypothetical protein